MIYCETLIILSAHWDQICHQLCFHKAVFFSFFCLLDSWSWYISCFSHTLRHSSLVFHLFEYKMHHGNIYQCLPVWKATYVCAFILSFFKIKLHCFTTLQLLVRASGRLTSITLDQFATGFPLGYFILLCAFLWNGSNNCFQYTSASSQLIQFTLVSVSVLPQGQ